MAASSAETLHVLTASQRLELRRGGRRLGSWPVSTARKGLGEVRGSERTPRGWHAVRIAIGAGCPPGAVFVGRRFSGEVWSPTLAATYPERDWILTRILWLTGLEPGRNRGGEVDTLRRFIYIHGCPDTEPVGLPLSHGCIRMHSRDLLDLFPQVAAGTRVEIR